MKETLKMMLSCDEVVVLDSIGHFISRGSVLEQLIAHEIGMTVRTFNKWSWEET
jgi:hypothetical protein